MVIDRAKLPLGILLTYVDPAIHGVSAFLRRVYAMEVCLSTWLPVGLVREIQFDNTTSIICSGVHTGPRKDVL